MPVVLSKTRGAARTRLYSGNRIGDSSEVGDVVADEDDEVVLRRGGQGTASGARCNRLAGLALGILRSPGQLD